MSETLWALTEEDVNIIARRKGLDPEKLNWHTVRKCIESGLQDWQTVVETAVDLAYEDD